MQEIMAQPAGDAPLVRMDGGVVSLGQQQLNLRELFAGWNAVAGQRGNAGSLATLARMSAAELEADAEIRGMDTGTMKDVLERFIRKSGAVVPPAGLQVPEVWKDLRFERITKCGPPHRVVGHTRIARCFGLMANIARSHLSQNKSATGYVVLKARDGKPRRLVRITSWTLRRILGLDTTSTTGAWKAEVAMVWPFPNAEGKVVRKVVLPRAVRGQPLTHGVHAGRDCAVGGRRWAGGGHEGGRP